MLLRLCLRLLLFPPCAVVRLKSIEFPNWRNSIRNVALSVLVPVCECCVSLSISIEWEFELDKMIIVSATESKGSLNYAWMMGNWCQDWKPTLLGRKKWLVKTALHLDAARIRDKTRQDNLTWLYYNVRPKKKLYYFSNITFQFLPHLHIRAN